MSGSDQSAHGKVRLIAELGHGGMADVYLALSSGPAGFNKLVVIKRIRVTLADDPEFVRMFQDEARLAARLNHPNVVQTYEIGGSGHRLFISMEYLEGQPLNRVVTRLGPQGLFPLAIHIRILIEALAGLHYAHELCDFDGKKLQVVHRDVSPHNVFVSYSGQVKVVDFGIAKALGSTTETRAGVLKGKVAYMAPEQALGDQVDRRADIFSVGVMLWEALTGTRLFRDENDLIILQKIVTQQIPRPRAVKPDVPERLEAICLKALANNREERYATAAELQRDLEKALESLGERPSLRDFGGLLAEEFREEEAKIKAVVEEQTSALRASTPGAPFESVSPSVDFGPLKLPVLDGEVEDPSEPASSDTGIDTKAPASLTMGRRATPSPAARAASSRWGLALIALAVILGAAAAIFLRPPPPSAPLTEPAITAPSALMTEPAGAAPARAGARIVAPLVREGLTTQASEGATLLAKSATPIQGKGPSVPVHVVPPPSPSLTSAPLPINTAR